MVELKVVVLFLTLLGVNIPKDGYEGPFSFPLEFENRATCEAFANTHMDAWRASEENTHKTDKFDIKFACSPVGEPA